MKNSIRLFVFTTMLVSALVSCQVEDYSIDPVQPKADLLDMSRIPKGDITLSCDDALCMVNLIDPETKGSDLSVSDVVTVSDSLGNPLMYAVNHEDGFTLLSATKHYYPVLAEVEHGRFDISDNSTGMTVLIDEMSQAISAARNDDSFLAEFRMSWVPFEENKIDVPVSTKSSSTYSAYINMLYSSYIPNWRAQGYNVYFLRERPEMMSQSLYSSFYNEAEDYMEQVDGFSVGNSAIILEQISEYSTGVSPLVATNWNQGYPFNSSDPQGRYLGCVTIAVAQIMKYHQYPTYSSLFPYYWSQMPNNTSSSTLCDFLYYLRTQLNVNDNGGSDITEARRYLRGKGYTVNKINHSGSSVLSSLINNNPVYMRGQAPDEQSGHAWVCDGYQSISQHAIYTLLIPMFDGETVWDLEEFDSQCEPANFNFVKFHMNWGWGGRYNGYFLDSNNRILNGSTVVHDYTSDREDLIISR